MLMNATYFAYNNLCLDIIVKNMVMLNSEIAYLKFIVNSIIKKLINNIKCEIILFSQNPAQIRSNILSF